MTTTHPAPALPRPERDAGGPRRLGIEIEFAGVPEDEAARIVASVTGGTPQAGPSQTWYIDTPRFGRCETYLDTRFRDDVARLGGAGAVDLARLVVPVELVTGPFDPADLDIFDRVVTALREAGAIGSRQGVLLGFGVHLNIEIAETGPDHLWRVLTAYALLEGYLRDVTGVDLSRRALPFVQPYPEALVDDLAGGQPATLSGLIETYLAHAPTRNHGLDMLPVFAHAAPDALAGRITDGTRTKPRPAFHFRMPDCRIDEVGWSIGTPWNTWLAVERLAEAPALLDAVRTAWQAWRQEPALHRGRWSRRVADILDADARRAAAAEAAQ